MKLRYLLFLICGFGLWAAIGCNSPDSNNQLDESPATVIDAAPSAVESSPDASAKPVIEAESDNERALNGTPHPEWGNGIIVPDETDYLPSETLSFPTEYITLLDAPGGKEKGSIFKSEDWSVTIYAEDTERELNPNGYPFKEVNYEGKYMIFHQLQDDHISIQVADRGPIYWISLPELNDAGFTFLTWEHFLSFQEQTYFPLPENGLNLRKSPEVTAQKLTLMNSDLYAIELTGNVEGLWREAEVVLWDSHPCGGDAKELNKYKGWFKALDDLGYPNIWFYPRGC